MTLLYRAIWQDDRSDLLESAGGHFERWLRSKGIELDVPADGLASVEVDGATVEVVVRHAQADGISALQLDLSEERHRLGERWSTTLRALAGARGDRWLWVDVAQVAEDFTARRIVAAPRLVRELVASAGAANGDPRVDHVRLTPDPQALHASSIAGLIRHPGRTLPIIVFSHDAAHDAATTIDRAGRTLRALQGAVQVFLLPPDDEAEFRDLLGPQLAAWGGSARLYLPNLDARGMRAERHRYVMPARMDRHPSSAAQIFGGLLTASITGRRPPTAFEPVRRELWGAGSGDDELFALADREIERLRHERDDLRLQLQHADDEILDARVDLLEAEEEVAQLQRQLLAFWRDRPAERAPITVEEVDELELPETVGEAISRAQGLPRLVIHGDAPRDIDDLDDHDNGPAWASKIWRGLEALSAYGEAGFDGNFKAWCMNSGDPRVWPSTDKKLAMRESESVESNQRLRAMRLLPVAESVDPDGRLHMWAHLKIAEGGGRLAPRVYFHDDTRGSTGGVHVGFIGPHHHMENTKTN